MMHAMSVPNRRWSCVVGTVVYLRNKHFSKAVGVTGGVPITVIMRFEPEASSFRIFGCNVSAKVPETLRRKMGMKALRGVIVGDSPNFLGFRVYNPTTRHKTTSIHIQF
jgi:hypothetical protein